MTGPQVLESVQFIMVNGKRMAAVSVEDWEALLDWLETLEDVQIARESFAALDAAGGDPASAGWLRWEDVQGELE